MSVLCLRKDVSRFIRQTAALSYHAPHRSAALIAAALQIAFLFLFMVQDLYVTTAFDSATGLLWSEMVQKVFAHAQTTVLQS